MQQSVGDTQARSKSSAGGEPEVSSKAEQRQSEEGGENCAESREEQHNSTAQGASQQGSLPDVSVRGNGEVQGAQGAMKPAFESESGDRPRSVSGQGKLEAEEPLDSPSPASSNGGC